MKKFAIAIALLLSFAAAAEAGWGRRVVVRRGFGGVRVRAPFVSVNTGRFRSRGVVVNGFGYSPFVQQRFVRQPFIQQRFVSPYGFGGGGFQSFRQPVIVNGGGCGAFFSY